MNKSNRLLFAVALLLTLLSFSEAQTFPNPAEPNPANRPLSADHNSCEGDFRTLREDFGIATFVSEYKAANMQSGRRLLATGPSLKGEK